MDLESIVTPSTSNSISKKPERTLPTLNTLVVTCNSSPTCGMVTDIANSSSRTTGSGRKSFTPWPMTANANDWARLPPWRASFTLTVHMPISALSTMTTSTLLMLSETPFVVERPFAKSFPRNTSPLGLVTSISRLLTNCVLEKGEPRSSDHASTVLNLELPCDILNVYVFEFPVPERTERSSTQIP